MLTMVKKKIQKTSQTHKKITVAFGYGLFALIIISTITSTVIPYTMLLMNPTVKHFNVAIFLVAFLAAAILPVLVSYIFGDRATHAKNKLAHHYNGVLFGIAGYWLSMSLISSFLTFIYTDLQSVFPELAVLIFNGVPILALLIVMLIVAITYALHQKKKDSVLQHAPYQVILIGVFTLHIVILLVSLFMQPNEYAVWSLVYIFVFLAMIAISYKCVAKLHSSRVTRLSAAVIAVSIPYVISIVASQFITYIEYSLFVPLGIGILAWIVYLFLMVRKA